MRSSRPVKSLGNGTTSHWDRYPTVTSDEAGILFAENTGTAHGVKSNRSRPLCSAEMRSCPVIALKVAVDSGAVDVTGDVGDLSEQAGRGEPGVDQVVQRHAGDVALAEQCVHDPQERALAVAAGAHQHDGLVQRVAGVEQVADELPHDVDHVSRHYLAQEAVELRAGGRRVPVDRQLHGGQHLGRVVVDLVGAPQVEPVAEVDHLADGLAGDAG